MNQQQPHDSITPITQHLDNIHSIVQEMHTKKQNMTKSALQNIESEINKVKNSIIHFLLPVATQTTEARTSKNHLSSQTPKHAKASYSDMARKHTAHSTIIVDASKSTTTGTNNEHTATEIINRITKHIADNNHPATIQKTATSNNDKVIIKFNKEDDVETIADELRSQLGIDARGRKPMLPKMTISHIPAHIDTQDNLRDHIIHNNPALIEPLTTGQLDILFTYKTRDFSSAVIKISPNVRSTILKQKTLTIGSRACPVRDRLQPQRCTQCCGFGHSKKHCRSETPTCAFCALNHASSSCPNKSYPEKLCCTNCQRSREPKSQGHTTFDNNCPILIKEQKRQINNTDYGSGPSPVF